MTAYVVELDLDGVTDKAGLMDRCAETLALPAWFGRDWDALADSLADPGVWPDEVGDRDLLLLVRGWRPYARVRPQEWETALDVFTRAMGGMPALTVRLALGGSSQ
ncbi:barstar family protein [Streptomyces sp. NPDC005017]|uniref:barstar family protein n=1 Tax=Streptomyces sp. NPDC005017 TaxID=3364706 RepID=UPI003682F1E3